jgi:4-amino-4-deoxy-L-arabinose transferase-like glycosyltransferase
MNKTTKSKRVFWLLFALCAGTRVYLFFNTHIIARDSVLYIEMAQTFLKGNFFEALQYITPPVYPLLLAGMNLAINNPEIAGKLVSLVAGTFAFFPLYYLGKRFFEEKVVFIGLFLFAIHPFLARYSAEVLSESTFIFLSISGFWLLWKGWEDKQYVYCALAGFILGLSCLTRAQGLIWIGAMFAVPFVFSFLKQKNDIEKGNLWICFLLAVFVFLLIIFPYSYFLKNITGEWTVRQSGAPALWMGTGGSTKQGLWETLIILLSHPWLIMKKLGWNIWNLVSLLPETIHYPFFFFLVVGLVARRHTERHFRGELYLVIICSVYILSHCLLYLKVRYLLPFVPFAIFWVGQGFWVTVSWVHKLYARYIPKSVGQHQPLVITVLVIFLTAASALPKTLEPQRLDKRDRKVIGNRIAALFPEHPVVLSSDGRIAFYAKGKNILFPKIREFTEFLEYAHNNKVDIIVMNKERVNEQRLIGDISVDFFAHADHPDLQLLFVHPSVNQQENKPGGSVFYVYRLIRKKNQPAK